MKKSFGQRLMCCYNTAASPSGGLPFIIAAVILFSVMCLFDQSSYSSDTLANIGGYIVLVSVTCCAVAALILKFLGRLNLNSSVALILICGFAVKLGYVIATPWNVRQHDVESLNSAGHLQYIYQIFSGNGLPDTNNWQFCHPPLHHFLAAGILKFSTALGFSLNRAIENIQLLTAFYSFSITVVFYKILKELGFTGRPLVISLAVLSFHPTLSIFAGSINNDVLTLLLMTCVLLFLIRWYKRPTAGYAVLIGVFTGLAMMAKFSAAIVGVVVAVAVIVKLYKGGLTGRAFLGQTACFVLIAGALGLWFQIRNMVLFDQPIGYVAPLSVDSDIYCGDRSFVERFLSIPKEEFTTKLYPAPFDDYNLPVYILKCSVFGEYSWDCHPAIASALLVANIFMVIISLIAGAVVLFNKKDKTFLVKLIFIFTWALQMVFFVYFNIKYPFGCTMDFRYIAITLVTGGVVLASLGEIAESSDKYGAIRVFYNISVAVSVIFCMLSVGFMTF